MKVAGRTLEAFCDLLVESPRRIDPRLLRGRGWVMLPLRGSLTSLEHAVALRRLAAAAGSGPLYAVVLRLWQRPLRIDAYEVPCDEGSIAEIASRLSDCLWFLTDASESFLINASGMEWFAVAAQRERAEGVIGAPAEAVIDRFELAEASRDDKLRDWEYTTVVETSRMLLRREWPVYPGVFASHEREVRVSDRQGYGTWNEAYYEPIENPPLLGGMHPQAFRDLLLAMPTRLHPHFMRERRWVAAPFDTDCSFEDDREIRDRFVECVRSESGYLYVFAMWPGADLPQPEYFRIEARQEMVGAVAEDLGCCDWFVTDANMTAMLHVDSDLYKYVVAGQRADVERIVDGDVRGEIDNWGDGHISRSDSIYGWLEKRFVRYCAEILDEADAAGY